MITLKITDVNSYEAAESYNNCGYTWFTILKYWKRC